MKKMKPTPSHIEERDNLDFMKGMSSKCIDLIATDGPYDPDKGNFDEADAEFIEENHEELTLILEASAISYGPKMRIYLGFLAIRLLEMHRILKDTGSIYIQCDEKAVHFIKQIMDCIFGRNNFRREIIWASDNISGYKSSAENWVRGNDLILYYVKSKDDFSFNKLYRPLKPQTKKLYNQEDKHGRLYRVREDKYGKSKKYYLDEHPGVPLSSVWTDIPSFQVATNSPEYRKFKELSSKSKRIIMQKPEALMRRIIEASSNPGDLVFDPFCGSGTTLVAANSLEREWLGCDNYPVAVELAYKRLDIPVDEIIKIQAEEEFNRGTKDKKESAESKAERCRKSMHGYAVARYIKDYPDGHDGYMAEACHIKPYARFEESRFDINNIILQSPTRHKAFDKFILTYDEYGSPIYSRKKKHSETVKILKKNFKENLRLKKNQKIFMKWHNEEFEKMEKQK